VPGHLHDHELAVSGSPVDAVPPTVADQRSFLRVVAEACERLGEGGSRLDGHAGDWIRVVNDRAEVPQQGWKLHVAAEYDTAEEVLERALPVLLDASVPFKVAGSARMLATLNDGFAGPSQVGKFITVYPADDEQAVRVAAALDESTRGLAGPPVPSDRRLRPGSVVYYRYGGFDGRCVQTAVGEIVPAIVTPDGEVVPDRRAAVYSPPDWAADPFEAAGVAADLPQRGRLVAGRYLLMALLARSPRADVYLAIDVDGGRRCVLKETWRPARGSVDHRLRHEADVLQALAPDERFPAVYDVHEDDERIALVLEDVEGQTLAADVFHHVCHGRLVAPEQVADWGRQLAAALASVHEAGYAYRDLKSTNVIVAPDGRLRLLDFELAHELGSTARVNGLGTLGYMSPQQQRGGPPAVTDDVYALGALLYMCATGSDPSQGPDGRSPVARPLELVNPLIGLPLAKAIERCLDEDASRRYSTMRRVAAVLARAGPTARAEPPAWGDPPLGPTEDDARERSHELAAGLLRTLRESARSTDAGVTWQSAHPLVMEGLSRDLNAGTAGTVLALAELVRALGADSDRELLAAGARALDAAPRPEGWPLGGLYVGEAGVAAALLRAGQVLGDEELLDAATDRGRFVADVPHTSPDLFNGSAGRLRFHLLLWDATGNADALEAAIAAGDRLIDVSERRRGETRWTIPEGHGDMSGKAFLGYAHGAAGIADALLDLHEVTGGRRFRDAALAGALWLERLAVPVLAEGDGLDWPRVEGEGPRGAFWCHGATGVGRFFLHAARLDVFPSASTLAARAARTAARGARHAGPTQCHGLAGNVEFLLDMWQETQDEAYLREARWLACLLETFAAKRDDLLVWPSDSPTVFSPDYAIGYAGVAVCLLRLADPDRVPHQLSRRGFAAV
jgi:class IV lanthipeptide synthase